VRGRGSTTTGYKPFDEKEQGGGWRVGGRPYLQFHALATHLDDLRAKLHACTDRYSSQFDNNHFTEMCSGSEADSYLRLIDFVYYSTLGLRVIQKKTPRLASIVETPSIKRSLIVFKRASSHNKSTYGKAQASPERATPQSYAQRNLPYNMYQIGTARHSSQFKKNYFTEMCSGSETGSYLRPIDSCITKLKAQGPSRTYNESKEGEEEDLHR